MQFPNEPISIGISFKTINIGIPPEDKAVLMKTYKLFVDNIQAEDIIDRLQQNQVIKFSDRQEIFALNKRHERMQLLLDKILNSKLSYAFKALTDSIKFKYKKIHEIVVQIRKETYKHGIRETVGTYNTKIEIVYIFQIRFRPFACSNNMF